MKVVFERNEADFAAIALPMAKNSNEVAAKNNQKKDNE
jgi:hypothetical protein